MRSFFSHYQRMARFLQTRCESEQELEESLVNENWLVARIVDFVNARGGSHGARFDTFVPDEFKTGRPGGPRKVDLVGYSRRQDGLVSVMAETKLMMKGGRDWAYEIITDLFRVACARHQTSNQTHRLVIAVGRDRFWQQADEQCSGLLRKLCPIDRRLSYITAGLTNRSRKTSLTDRWRKEHEGYIEEYLRPHLPSSVRIELVGLARSARGETEDPDRGITARMWRVYPGKRSAA